MSLCPAFVRAEDGNLYRNPTIRGEDWYVCFDDDDPPELVVFAPTFERAWRRMWTLKRQHGFIGSFQEYWHPVRYSWRNGCPKNLSAWSRFFGLAAPIPVPTDRGPVTNLKREYVLYDPVAAGREVW